MVIWNNMAVICTTKYFPAIPMVPQQVKWNTLEHEILQGTKLQIRRGQYLIYNGITHTLLDK